MKSYLLILFLLAPTFAFSETIKCEGRTDTNVKFELNISNSKSTIKYFYDNSNRGVLQGLHLHDQKVFISNSILRYSDRFNESDYLELLTDNAGNIKESFFNKPLSGFNRYKLNCNLEGQLPFPPKCSANPNETLISNIKQQSNLNDLNWDLYCGADVNYKNKKGCTPILYLFDDNCGEKSSLQMRSVFSNKQIVLDLLINNGAYIDARDPLTNETALLKASNRYVEDVYSSFIAAEADFNAQDTQGNTALMNAVMSNNRFLVQDILMGNPDRTLKNKQGFTAYDIAKKWNKTDVVNLVAIPNEFITITGMENGACSPSIIKIKAETVIEFTLEANNQNMFLLKSEDLNLELMANKGASVKTTYNALRRGLFKVYCGVHGSSSNDTFINIEID